MVVNTLMRFNCFVKQYKKTRGYPLVFLFFSRNIAMFTLCFQYNIHSAKKARHKASL